MYLPGTYKLQYRYDISICQTIPVTYLLKSLRYLKIPDGEEEGEKFSKCDHQGDSETGTLWPTENNQHFNQRQPDCGSGLVWDRVSIRLLGKDQGLD